MLFIDTLASLRRLSVAITLLAFLACQPTAPPADVVATTDLGEISRAEVEDFILSQPASRRSPPADQPLPEWRHEKLEELILARALEAEARSQRLAETEEGERLLTGRIEPILVQAIAARVIRERVNIAEEDLRSFYDAHPEEFSHPEQIRVRNIYRRVARDAPPEDWEAARLEMNDILNQIHRGARFGDLARAHSDSETARLDGLIGRLDRGKLDPALEEILWGLGEGEVSKTIRTPVGFQIFKVENYLGNFKMDFEDARTRLHRRLTREATEKAEAAMLQELLDASGAVYDPTLMSTGDGDDILFALEDDSVAVADFHQRLDSIGFSKARELTLRQQLDQAVRERLYLWQAEQDGLAEYPEIAAQLEQVEREVLIALALRERGRAIVHELKDKDLQEFYATREQRYRTPRLIHLRILTRDFPSEGIWYEVYEELDRLADEIRAGKRGFEEAVREFSTDFTAIRGGDVGAIRPEAIAEWAGPKAQHDVLELAPGELSGPLLIERHNPNRLTYERAGYMLVRLEAIEESRIRLFEEVREIVIEQYLESGRGELQAKMREQILHSVDTEIYEENL
ncbi:MAG: hypothetical protein GY906_35750 [bacterium]|nr:hypothetical protein [bacterium]